MCLKRGHSPTLMDAAGQHKVKVVCRVNERDEESGGTLYNTVAIIGSDGRILNKHRKLMLTNPVRIDWGIGEGYRWVVGSGCALKRQRSPGGNIVARPLRKDVGLLYVGVNTAAVGAAAAVSMWSGTTPLTYYTSMAYYRS